MAGTSISVKGLESVHQAFNELLRDSKNLTPALDNVGDYVDETTKERFVDQETPDGQAWEPLSELTLSRKKRKDKILTESGTLSGNLHYQLIGNKLEYGSNEEYAAMHQFGGITSPASLFPNREIPARPFIGINLSDKTEILNIIRDHLSPSKAI